MQRLACSGKGNLQRAKELYQRTDYQRSLALLHSASQPDGAAYCLMGQDYFMLGEYKKATEAFQKGPGAGAPNRNMRTGWAAPSAGAPRRPIFLMAPGYASKARQYFERAVALDPANEEALNDLFDYYLEAPGFLGGGYDKAESVAKRSRNAITPKGTSPQAQLADKRKQFDTAEDQLRRAMELAPRQVGRVLDLAKYLAKRGRIQESEAAFDKAAQLAPNSPKVMFRARPHLRGAKAQPGQSQRTADPISEKQSDARRSAAPAGRETAASRSPAPSVGA